MISDVFIERPRFALVISIVLTLAGALAVKTLPITQYPQVTPPQVSVRTRYPGANANDLANTVAIPLEEEVNGVDDMLYMSSDCDDSGNYNMTVTFEIGTNLDLDMVKVQNRVQQATPRLPEEVTKQGVSVYTRSSDMLGFLTLPIAVRAGMTALKYPEDMQKLVPAMGQNVIVVLATDFLLAVGLVLELIFSV